MSWLVAQLTFEEGKDYSWQLKRPVDLIWDGKFLPGSKSGNEQILYVSTAYGKASRRIYSASSASLF